MLIYLLLHDLHFGKETLTSFLLQFLHLELLLLPTAALLSCSRAFAYVVPLPGLDHLPQPPLGQLAVSSPSRLTWDALSLLKPSLSPV